MKKFFFFSFLIFVFFVNSAFGQNKIYRHLYRMPEIEREDCPYPWCDRGIKDYIAIAPNDPNLYLGDLISYEKPSNWKNFKPLVEKVDELTSGLFSQRDKIKVIADWVKSSKNYAYPNYQSWPPTIEDIWNSPVGVCGDAAFLLVAMLRVAKIPAMVVDSFSREHAVARVWDGDIGHWIIVDATFSADKNKASKAVVYEWDDYRFVAAFQERPIRIFKDVSIPSNWVDNGGTVDTLVQSQVEIVNESEKLAKIGMSYGKLVFPITNKFLYFDPATKNLTEDYCKDCQKTFIYVRIDADDNDCLASKGSWYSGYLKFVNVSPVVRVIDSKIGSAILSNWGNGYVRTILPTCGAWKISYYFSNLDLNANLSGDCQKLATAVFYLNNPGDLVVITPNMLEIEPGANQYYFKVLVDTLEKFLK